MDPTTLLGLMALTRTPSERADVLGDAAANYCRTRLLTVVTLDAATAVVARAAVLAGKPLTDVVEAWEARTPNPVTRARHRELGRDLLRRAGQEETSVPRAVALGMLAADAGIDAEDLARMIAYDDVLGVLETAHYTDASVWTAALFGDIKQVASHVAHLEEPVAIPATGALLTSYAEAR